jgi:hypothetical protein
MRPFLAAFVVAAVACASSDSTPPARAVPGADVKWASELVGPVIAVGGYLGHESAVLRMDSLWPGPMPPCAQEFLLERRRSDGTVRWAVDVPAATPPSFALFDWSTAILGYQTCGGASGNDVGPAELVAVDANGDVAWRIVDAGVAPVSFVQVSADAGAIAALVQEYPAPIGAPAQRWIRRYAANGTLLEEQAAPADVLGVALDPVGALYVLTRTQLEKFSSAGLLLFTAVPPPPATGIERVLPLRDGRSAVLGRYRGDLAWGEMSLRYDPDAFFNPLPFLAVLDAVGVPEWGVVASDVSVFAAAADGGLLVAGGEPAPNGVGCDELFVRALAPDGAVRWERVLDGEGCSAAPQAGTSIGWVTAVASAGAFDATDVIVGGGTHIYTAVANGERALLFGDERLWRGTGWAGAFRAPAAP